MSLQLTITDYQNETRWRWVLSDEKGNFLTDHEVSLDANAPVYRGFKDLPGYLRHHIPATPAAQVLREVGEWMGEKVFGGLADALRERMQSPATVVRVSVPKEAQDLLFRPFELAHLDGKPFAEHGLRFVYQLADARPPTTTKPTPAPLRVLAVFSLPDEANPLNLRRERYQLKRLLDQIAQTHGVAIAPLRVIQYGATRQTLQDALEEGDGWDIIHFSGHGLAGELLLEHVHGALTGGEEDADARAVDVRRFEPGLSDRFVRRRQMTTQYGWMFEPDGRFSWRARGAARDVVPTD